MARRDVSDRWQQRVAWHELGHALVNVRLGVRIVRVVHQVRGGWTEHDAKLHQWREFSIGCLGGSAGEWVWEKYHGGWFGSRSHCTSDLELFAEASQGRISESSARSKARKLLLRERDLIEELAPRLIMEGELTERDLR